MTSKQQIAQKIIDFGKTKEVLDTENGFVGQNKDINRFLRNTPFAYILGVLYDQQIKAETAWSIPYYIYQELGHLDVEKIAKMQSSEILEIFNRTAKPRYPPKMAEWTVNAAKEEAIFSARQLNPDYPGIFDKPCWIIGRGYCFEQNPNCNACPLIKVCKYNK
ncbi:MAG: hypothetical protein B6U87_02220 [Candidatus Aenigmarchaeota archaeon ex4484_52]|nr:MAG: hypothetical protein B6U87_02220 [Candidatus Aenigmarchaeota archaeon ex4484_52]